MKIKWEDDEGKPLSPATMDGLAERTAMATRSPGRHEVAYTILGDTLILAYRDGRHVCLYDCEIRRTGTAKMRKETS